MHSRSTSFSGHHAALCAAACGVSFISGTSRLPALPHALILVRFIAHISVSYDSVLVLSISSGRGCALLLFTLDLGAVNKLYQAKQDTACTTFRRRSSAWYLILGGMLCAESMVTEFPETVFEYC